MTPLPITSVACDVCSSLCPSPLLDYQGYQIRVCANCSRRFVSERIPEAFLDDSYSRAYYVPASGEPASNGYVDYLATASTKLQSFVSWFRCLEAEIGTRGRHVDFGCTIGTMVRAAQNCGWDACGYEKSEWAALYTTNLVNLRGARLFCN
jgi:hypothetical protein